MWHMPHCIISTPTIGGLHMFTTTVVQGGVCVLVKGLQTHVPHYVNPCTDYCIDEMSNATIGKGSTNTYA